MSRDHFDDECPDCRPTMVDVKTGLPLADDSAEMVVINRLWSEITYADRCAWHRFTCQNSRSPGDARRAKVFADRVQAALNALGVAAK